MPSVGTKGKGRKTVHLNIFSWEFKKLGPGKTRSHWESRRSLSSVPRPGRVLLTFYCQLPLVFHIGSQTGEKKGRGGGGREGVKGGRRAGGGQEERRKGRKNNRNFFFLILNVKGGNIPKKEQVKKTCQI